MGVMNGTHFSVDEAAQRLGCHDETIRRYIRRGKLKAYKKGREYRIYETDLNEFVEQNKFIMEGKENDQNESSGSEPNGNEC